MDEQTQRLSAMFMPYAAEQMQRARDTKTRFCHYTSAETGLKILTSGRMYLRNAILMNDFSEMAYGRDCLFEALDGDIGKRLDKILGEVQFNLLSILTHNFEQAIDNISYETYLTAISEHDPPDDEFGRLSMWRAYAPKNGVAFVFNNSPFLSESNALNAFTSPVLYATQQQFGEQFRLVIDNIESNLDELREYGGGWLHDTLINVFQFATQTTKHPSFSEEKEWRIIYNPHLLETRNLLDDLQKSRIPSEIVSLNGVPQRVHAIPFRDYPDENFIGASIPALLDRVLIGPTQDGYAIANAYIDILQSLGVEEPAEKVFVTGIPLRQ